MSVELDIESPITFPAVTICNLNAFDTSDQAVIDTIKLMQSIGLIKNPSPNISPNKYVNELENSLKIFVKRKNTENLRKNPPPKSLRIGPGAVSNLSNISLTGSVGSVHNSNINSTLVSNNNGSNGQRNTSSNGIINNNNQTNNSNNNINVDIGFKLNNMLLSCKFNEIDCNYTDFYDFYSFEYGNCYTFNKKNSQDLRAVGQIKVGLELELYAGNSGLKLML